MTLTPLQDSWSLEARLECMILLGLLHFKGPKEESFDSKMFSGSQIHGKRMFS